MKLWSFFVRFVACFGQKLLAVAMSVSPLQSEMSFLDCWTPETISESKILSIALHKRSYVDLKVRNKFSITGIGNFRYFAINMENYFLKFSLTPNRTCRA